LLFAILFMFKIDSTFDSAREYVSAISEMATPLLCSRRMATFIVIS
jgi:hypothetical protein